MDEIDNLRRILKNYFNAEDGLSEEVSIGLYQRSFSSPEQRRTLRDQLSRAFADPLRDWRSLLANGEYEVYFAATEEEARAFARRILWDPILG
ncbi:hypothetical protein [Lysobacter sp. Root604]|uniref:hypothetical protein n=1 Tax=Lysobacter sp. Root604 TaxID=1736568 RepID=UPI0006FD1832|nr:hypothetical protein [Lysobacter sp. Root604]